MEIFNIYREGAAGSVPARGAGSRCLLGRGGQGSGFLGASLQLPEEFMHPTPIPMEQKDLSLAGTAGEEADSGGDGDAGAVGGWAAPMQM